MDHPDFFRWLDSESEAALLGAGRRRVMPPRSVIFLQGDPMQELLLVQRGRIRVFFTSAAGHAVTFSYWNAGALVGTPSVHEPFDHAWSAETVLETEVIAVPRADMLAVMQRHPRLMLGVIEALEFKAKRLGGLLQAHATASAGERLQLVLRHLADIYGRRVDNGILIGIPVNHDDIASLAGASRQWVTTMLGRLEQQGLLARQGRRLFLPDPGRLFAQPGSSSG